MLKTIKYKEYKHRIWKKLENNQQFNISLFIIIFALPNDSTFNANGF